MTGRTISHFEILEKLGEGGMGVVYKARDTRLERFVAIKFLSAGVVSDPDRRRRFIQEARSASALNHPNIITVYDINAEGEFAFIAMEYVVGKTIDQLIGRKGLRLNDALKYAAQIADALATAHSAGIVHRDLKPANVMVTEKGVVKVLDFGLAKLAERGMRETNETVTAGALGATATEPPMTAEGSIIGTVAYMSPEQAQGKSLDGRSDIFSFGAVLYEMTTGRRAFSGDTKMSTLAAVLNLEPKPAHDLVPDLPREVERVMDLCLRKDPARRFQHMADLKVALDAVREESEPGAAATAARSDMRRSRLRLAIAALGVAALGGAVAWFSFRRPSPPTPRAFKIVPLTTYPGTERHPSFSPDGSQVAFSWNGDKQDNFDIYVKLVTGGPPLRLTTNPASDTGPSWSPDGAQIAFLRDVGDRADVLLISPLGGPERKLTDARGPFLAWMPDAKSLIVEDRDGEAPSLFLVSLATGEKKRLPPLREAHFFGDDFGIGHRFDVSADGSRLAFTRWFSAGTAEVYVSPIEKWAPRRLTTDNAMADGVAWTSDGREVIFSSNRRGGSGLWRIAADAPPGTEPELVSGAGDGASFPVISRGGPGRPVRLAYERSVRNVNIWRMGTSGGESSAVQVISSTGEEAAPQLSPDGQRIAFTSRRTGNVEIWMCDRDGRNPIQLTFMGTYCGSPRWSPDGKHIAFDGRTGGKADVYVVGADRGAPRRLTADKSENARPNWSRDGQWIYFRSNRSGSRQIWRMPFQAGVATQMTQNGGFEAIESPDGRTLFYIKSGISPGLWAVPVVGGQERLILDSVSHSYWGVAEQGIYFVDFAETSYPNTPKSIKFFQPDTRHIKVVGVIRKAVDRAVPGFCVSWDGREILWAQVDRVEADLMMMENFR